MAEDYKLRFVALFFIKKGSISFFFVNGENEGEKIRIPDRKNILLL